MRVTILLTLFLSTTLASGVSYLKESNPPETPQGETKPADPVQREIFANGVVEGRCPEAHLRFELEGRLLSVHVDEGDQVSQGEVLARLDATVWQEKREMAEACLELAQAEKEVLLNGARQETRDVLAAQVKVASVGVTRSRKEFQRVKNLAQRNAATEQEFDDREAAFTKAEAELEVAQKALDEVGAAARADQVRIADARIRLEETRVRQARTMLQKTELRAPTDAVVLRVRGESGELVGPNGLEPVITLVDASQTRVRAFVEELDATRVTAGMNAHVEVDGLAERRFAGKIISSSPCMRPKTEFDNTPGERMDVKVREVVIRLDDRSALGQLVVGLPVDVFIHAEPDPATSSSLE